MLHPSEAPDTRQGLLFLHIPKTAGTSFRVAVDRPFGKTKVYSDYGNKKKSSRLLRKCHQSGDFSPIARLSHNKSILIGHFMLRRHARHYPVQNVLSFVREPVQRVMSHYYYMLRTGRFAGELETFINDPRFCNVQSKVFCHCPVEAIGFIGLTERYEESLEIINHYYSLDIPVKVVNANERKEGRQYDVDEGILELIRNNNAQDIQLYERLKSLFQTRYEFFKNDKSYTYGMIESIAERKICGWAFSQDSDAPVSLEVLLNGKFAGEIVAEKHRPDFRKVNMPRKGRIGFTYVADNDLSPQDNIQLRVAATGQLIG